MLAVQFKHRRHNAVFIGGFGNDFRLNTFRLRLGKYPAQYETGKDAAFGRPLRGGNLQINCLHILLHIYSPHPPLVL